jgi:hypothetical protein
VFYITALQLIAINRMEDETGTKEGHKKFEGGYINILFAICKQFAYLIYTKDVLMLKQSYTAPGSLCRKKFAALAI